MNINLVMAKTTQDKIREIKRLMDEVITETTVKSNELTSDGNSTLNALGRMLNASVDDYKKFVYNHWEHGDDKILLRLDQYDNKENFK